VNKLFLALALGMVVAGTAHAAVIDLPSAPDAAASHPRVSTLAPTPRLDIVAPPARMSELPEPEVFAMMLVGLVLLGYRARRRDSSEKFK